ncbi:uncharacterized protein LOC143300219 [Babylonia areolata]|uniref:uncharacterized protein LOC143300219 n=1 Tax=Babylonia areolata TaxID=304850 RepID=UPI003FD2142F
MMCTTATVSISSATGCAPFGLIGFPGWFHAVRAMEALCTAGLIIACIYAVATNCCRSIPGPQSRILEGFAGLSGILGFIGCMVYVGMIKEGNSFSILIAAILFDSNTMKNDLDWAFYLAAVGSGLVVIAAILIAITNKPLDVQPNTGGMVMTPATAQPQPCVVQPGNYPPQPYVAQPGYYPSQSYPAPKAGYPAE